MKRWTVWAVTREPVYASDGGLIDYAETDVDTTVEAATETEAVQAFHDWMHWEGPECAGEPFIWCVAER